MTALQAIGIGLLVAVFAAFFAATAWMEGWLVAALVWGASIAITGVVVLGVFLATGGTL